MQDALLRKYQEEIQQLRAELDTAKFPHQDSRRADWDSNGAEAQSNTVSVQSKGSSTLDATLPAQVYIMRITFPWLQAIMDMPHWFHSEALGM